MKTNEALKDRLAKYVSAFFEAVSTGSLLSFCFVKVDYAPLYGGLFGASIVFWFIYLDERDILRENSKKI